MTNAADRKTIPLRHATEDEEHSLEMCDGLHNGQTNLTTYHKSIRPKRLFQRRERQEIFTAISRKRATPRKVGPDHVQQNFWVVDFFLLL